MRTLLAAVVVWTMIVGTTPDGDPVTMTFEIDQTALTLLLAERATERAEARRVESTPITEPTTPATTLPPHPCLLVPDPGPVYLTLDTMWLCQDIAPYFDPEHLLRALVVVECESNGDPYANDREHGHLANRPQGIWSHMSRWWPERSLRAFGYLIDPYDTRQASALASWLVYHTSAGWGHWPTCNRWADEVVARAGGSWE